MDDDTDERRIREHLDGNDFLSWLDPEPHTVEPGRVVLRVPYGERLADPAADGEYVHSGVLSTLADAASGAALRTMLEHPRETGVMTTNVNVSFLRPATDDVYVAAEVARAGGSVGVAEVTVTSGPADGGRQTVATGTTTYRLFRPD
jgi:uncharacterized protein (TIGR00369 family)